MTFEDYLIYPKYPETVIYNQINRSRTSFLLYFVINTIVKVTAEIKKNTFMQNVSPYSYEAHSKNKKDEPRWR